MTSNTRILRPTFPVYLTLMLLLCCVFKGQAAAIKENTKKVQLVAVRPDRVVLVGIIRTSVVVAWLVNRDSGKTTVVKPGALLQIGAASASIIHIASHTVYVKVNSRIRKWKLGKTFAQVIDPIPDPADKKPTSIGGVE